MEQGARKSFSLSELLNSVSAALKHYFVDNNGNTAYYWIRAEIATVSLKGGHCYFELVDGESKCRANLWRTYYGAVAQKFEKGTGRKLEKGIKVMMLVSVEFNAQYGFSLCVYDIDPTYTVGDLAEKKQKTIQRLKDEGSFDLNRGMVMPLLPRRIAIISAKTAAGLQDFCHQLDNNEQGYKFYYAVFEAVMQGERSPESVVSALGKIERLKENFDTVVIVRGGGSELDLVAFDDYNVADAVAKFPLPVLAGIGHTKDVSVVDMVAYMSKKTPTAVAEYLITKFNEQNNLIENISMDLGEEIEKMLDDETTNIKEAFGIINQTAANMMREAMMSVSALTVKTKQGARQSIERNVADINMKSVVLEKSCAALSDKSKARLGNLEVRINAVNPQEVLKRGYTLTMKDGHATRASELKEGDEIETMFCDGKVRSKVEICN